MIDSGLFVGTLRHRRFTPIAHAFTYPLFMALLDIDRVPELMARVAADEPQPLELGELPRPRSPRRSARARSGNGLAVDAARHGIDLPDGRIFLLTHLRYLGYGFNPVSFFYCFDRAEQLQVVACRGEQHLRRDPQLLAAARSGVAQLSRRRDQVPLRVAVHAGRPRVHVRLHAAGGSPRRAHGDQSRPARSASTRRCRSNDAPGTRRRSVGCCCGIPR